MENSDGILLIQPRHIYAPSVDSREKGHVYMPTSLLSIATIFIELGINIKIVDENIHRAKFNSKIIGVNLLGAPYVTEILKLKKRIENIHESDYTLLLGGQVINGFSEKEFKYLFSKNAINGNSYSELSNFFNITKDLIPRIEDLSFIKAFDLIDNDTFKMYLKEEFTFYLSQGCKHSCSFCSAQRSVNIKELEIKERKVETYRDLKKAFLDLEYLIKKAISFDIYKLEFYLSNLDLFQSPLKLNEFTLGILKLKEKYPKIDLKFRGLSTCRSFLKTHKKYPNIINNLMKAGLSQVGFGVDGATPKVYKETRKPQTVQESLDAIRISKTVYNITPEVLMVFGHNDKEDEKSLILALQFCKDMQLKYGALPRPHVAKDVVPGNDGWLTKKKEKNIFLKNPLLFQNLDFTAIPSKVTHPNDKFRKIVEKYYKKVCELPNSLTQYTLAESPFMTKYEILKVRKHNQCRYDI